MSRYAETTEVSAERSRAEIERTLRRYGASGFLYAWQERRAAVAFDLMGRRVLFELPLPEADDPAFTETPSGRARSPAQAEKAWQQACRQRWRALALAIKAKLEAVEAGITAFDTEFLAHLVLPGGDTVGRRLAPELERALAGDRLPPLLPGPGQAQEAER